jgi:chromosome segregation ATPase
MRAYLALTIEQVREFYAQKSFNPEIVYAPTIKFITENPELDEEEAEYEILSSKLQKITDAIERRQSHLGKLDEDEDMKALTDKKKVKELEKDIKALEKAKAKLEKIINKKGGKAKKVEVIDEVEDDVDDELRASAEYLQAKEDAEQRYDEGEEIDSIMSNYPNLSDEDQERLYQDLEGKMNGMDY